MQASASTGASAPKAGWWIRFFAYLIDGLVIGIPAAIVGFILSLPFGGMTSSGGTMNAGATSIFYLIVVVGTAAYFVYFWSQRDGQTIMNKAFNIKVVRADGSPMTVSTGIVRYIGYILNSIIFGLPIGWLWAAWDPNKQGWHDKIAGTYVIRTA
jgi:uncharacterized RDD family membrane protein YckC